MWTGKGCRDRVPVCPHAGPGSEGTCLLVAVAQRVQRVLSALVEREVLMRVAGTASVFLVYIPRGM